MIPEGMTAEKLRNFAAGIGNYYRTREWCDAAVAEMRSWADALEGVPPQPTAGSAFAEANPEAEQRRLRMMADLKARGVLPVDETGGETR